MNTHDFPPSTSLSNRWSSSDVQLLPRGAGPVISWPSARSRSSGWLRVLLECPAVGGSRDKLFVPELSPSKLRLCEVVAGFEQQAKFAHLYRTCCRPPLYGGTHATTISPRGELFFNQISDCMSVGVETQTSAARVYSFGLWSPRSLADAVAHEARAVRP